MTCATRARAKDRTSIVQIQILAPKMRATKCPDVFRLPHPLDRSAQTETPVRSTITARMQNASPVHKKTVTTTVSARLILVTLQTVRV